MEILKDRWMDIYIYINIDREICRQTQQVGTEANKVQRREVERDDHGGHKKRSLFS